MSKRQLDEVWKELAAELHSTTVATVRVVDEVIQRLDERERGRPARDAQARRRAIEEAKRTPAPFKKRSRP